MSNIKEALSTWDAADELLAEKIDEIQTRMGADKIAGGTGGSVKKSNGLIIINLNFSFTYNGETDPSYDTDTNLTSFVFPSNFAMKKSVYSSAVVITGSWNPRSFAYVSVGQSSTTNKPKLSVRPFGTNLTSGNTYRVIGQIVFGTESGDFI